MITQLSVIWREFFMSFGKFNLSYSFEKEGTVKWKKQEIEEELHTKKAQLTEVGKYHWMYQCTIN